jgi:PAS domain-containing protein
MLDGLPDAAAALAAALDAVPEHVVLLDEEGRIVHANAAWRAYARENGSTVERWAGVDYRAASDDADDAVARGVRETLSGERDGFEHEYACHAPDELRWYRLRATRVDVPGVGAVVTHTDVSTSRTVDVVLGRSATHDARTGLYNDRAINAHARRMVVEGRGVTVVRVTLDESEADGEDDAIAPIATTLAERFPSTTTIGRVPRGLLLVQGGETDEELLETLRRTYEAIARVAPARRVTLTGERLSRGERPGTDGPTPDGDA